MYDKQNMAAASSSSGANGFNMGALSSALNDVSASIEAARAMASDAELDAMLDMFESVKVSAKKIAQKKRSASRGKRKTQAEEAHELKMRDLQRQLKTETDAANRAIRELTRLSRGPSSHAANASAIEKARASVAASQRRLAHITSQINNPNTGMNANVNNNGRASSGRRKSRNRNRNTMNNNNRNRSPRRGGATRKRSNK